MAILGVTAAASRPAANYLVASAAPVAGPVPTAGCAKGYWVQSVAAVGDVLVLEDRSVWLTRPDKFKAALWLQTTNVLVNLDQRGAAVCRRYPS